MLCKLFYSCAEQGLLFSCSVWASRCSGFSCCGAQALRHVGFSSCSSRALDHPRPGIKPMSPTLAGGFFIMESPAKPLSFKVSPLSCPNFPAALRDQWVMSDPLHSTKDVNGSSEKLRDSHKDQVNDAWGHNSNPSYLVQVQGLPPKAAHRMSWREI